MTINTRPLIGIMVNSPKPLPSYNFAASLEVDLLVFSPKRINWRNKSVSGFILENGKWQKQTCPFPAAVYNRLYSSKKTLVNKLEKIIGEGKVFNYSTKFNKWEIYNILRKSKVLNYLPDTFLYNESTVFNILEKYPTLILKPCVGCLGHEVYLIERPDDSKYQLYHNLDLPKIATGDKKEFVDRINKLIGKKKFIVQQFIPWDQVEQKIYDIRIYVQKDYQGQWTVSKGFSRVGFPNSYISNYCTQLKSYTDILLENNKLTGNHLKKMELISLQAAKAIEEKLGHLGEISVDFILDHQGKPWIIEANGKTQKKFVNRVKDAQLARTVYLKPLQYARFLATKK